MTHTVAVREFEGPLGLLLELVERNQLAVTEISVAAITAQYLEHIRTLTSQDPVHLSEFLQLGARLLYIKSLALLPRESAAEQTEELRQLNLELEEYKRYQAAAKALARLESHPSWVRPVVSRLQPHEVPLPEINLQQLAEAFQRTLRTKEPARPQGIIRHTLTQDEATRHIRRRLAQGSFALQGLLDELKDRLEVIVTFLAILELMRTRELRVVQEGQFSHMMVEANHAPA